MNKAKQTLTPKQLSLMNSVSGRKAVSLGKMGVSPVGKVKGTKPC